MENIRNFGIGAVAGLALGAGALQQLPQVSKQENLEDRLSAVSQPYEMVSDPQGTYLHIGTIQNPEQLQETINKLENFCIDADGSYDCGVITQFNEAPEVKDRPQINDSVDVFVDTNSCDKNRIASRLGQEGYDIAKVSEFVDGGEWKIEAPTTYHFTEESARKLQTNYREEIIEAARTYNLNPIHIATLISSESSFENGKVSTSGARGIMQIKPGTAIQFGYDAEDLDDPAKNIMAGTAYLAEALEKFGDIERAIGAYHDGVNGVQRDVNKHGCEAVYENLSPEGRKHVRKFDEVKRIVNTQPNISTESFSQAYRQALPRINSE